MEISQNNEGNWLDREEVQWIKDSLGDPPLPCCPIYFITIADKCKEKIAYIGKTSSQDISLCRWASSCYATS